MTDQQQGTNQDGVAAQGNRNEKPACHAPRQLRIWDAWLYLLCPQHPASSAEGNDNGLLADDLQLEPSATRLLRFLRENHPELIKAEPSGDKTLLLDANHSRHIEQRLIEIIPVDERVDRLFRFWQVIERGNRENRWSIEIPSIPVQLPSPRPYTDDQAFESMTALENGGYFEALLRRCTPEACKSDDFWDLVFSVAVCFGGLTDIPSIWALPKAAQNAPDHLLYLEVELPARGDIPASRRLHWLDPVSRWLLYHAKRIKMPPPPRSTRTKSGGQSRQNAPRLYSRITNCFRSLELPIHWPANWTEYRAAILQRYMLYLPPHLIAYSKGDCKPTGLSASQWERLMRPMKPVVIGRLDIELASESTETEPTLADSPDSNDCPNEPTHEPPWDRGFSDLLAVIRKMRTSTPRTVQKWWDTEGNRTRYSPALARLVEWVTDWLMTKNSHHRKPLAPRTIQAYLYTFGSRFIEALGDTDPAQLSVADDFIEVYEEIFDDQASLEQMKRARRGAESFHAFLVERHARPSLDDTSLFARNQRNQLNVDARIISRAEFDRTLLWLDRTYARNDEARLTARTLAILGYFAGLRRSEAMGLEIQDVETDPAWDLVVSPNRHRRLKSSSAHRVLPLPSLLPGDYLEEVQRFIQHSRETAKHAKCWLLFPRLKKHKETTRPDDEYLRLEKAARQHFTRIADALARVTRDSGLRFHHLRHSFANRIFMLSRRYEAATNGHTDSWIPDLIGLDRVSERRESLLDTSKTARRGLYLVARLMGHARPETTVAHYIHTMDHELGRASAHLLPSSISTTDIARIAGIGERRVTQFADALGAIEPGDLLNALLQQWKQPPQPCDSALPLDLALPTDDYQRKLLLTEAINQHREGAGEHGIQTIFPWTQDQIETIKADLVRLPEHLRHPPHGNSEGLLSPPKTQQAQRIARKTLEFIRKMNEGDTEVPKRTVQHVRTTLLKHRDGIDRPRESSLLDVTIPSVTLVRSWLRFLTDLDLLEHYEIRHCPRLQKTTFSAGQQLAYWESIFPQANIKPGTPSLADPTPVRGQLQFRMKSPSREGRFVSLGLYGIYWALFIDRSNISQSHSASRGE